MKAFLIIMALIIGSGVAYYFVSPVFTTFAVDDAAPEAVLPELMPSGAERLSPEEKAAMDTAMTESEPMPPMDEGEPRTAPSLSVYSDVMPTSGHPAEGVVRVIPTAEGDIIRFEDFKTLNGPQLHVYLAKDLDAEEFIDLGPIRGTEGNINYPVPPETDLDEYRYVMHWCVPFGVLFNYADLTPPEA